MVYSKEKSIFIWMNVTNVYPLIWTLHQWDKRYVIGQYITLWISFPQIRKIVAQVTYHNYVTKEMHFSWSSK